MTAIVANENSVQLMTASLLSKNLLYAHIPLRQRSDNPC